MTPAKAKRDDALKNVISRVSSAVKRKGLSPLDGNDVIGLGDTLCNICSTMQGCAMGIGFFHPEVPADTLSNIFWEMGLLQGLGRPVLIVTNKKESLPSDFSRDFCIFYGSNPQYIRAFSDLVQSIKERENYYIGSLADEALRNADYEKTIKYYQEAFLINGNRRILTKMRRLRRDVKPKHIPLELKNRLISMIDSFLDDAS
ncbi:MAG: hypothetical protein MUO17_00800 [Dehalococcoidales bacterium]|nr:hypothetical protein [Dehalococcoidales bacterium]